jgi:hypothetical protein
MLFKLQAISAILAVFGLQFLPHFTLIQSLLLVLDAKVARQLHPITRL